MRLSRAALARVLHGALDVTRSSRRLSVAGPSCDEMSRCIPCRRMSSPPMRESSETKCPLRRYQSMVQEGLLQHDAQQEVVAQMLDKLLGHMKDYQQEMEGYQVILKKWTNERTQHKAIILKEESEVEARRRLQRIAQEKWSGVWGWWSRSGFELDPEN